MVYDKVKSRGAIWQGPCGGYWHLARLRNHTKQQGSIYIVVIGEGDKRAQMQCVLNLAALEIERPTGGQGRRPVSAKKDRHHARGFRAPLRPQAQRGLQKREFLGILQDKAKTLARMVGVAMQGHAGAKRTGCVRLLPKAGECLAQRSSLDNEIFLGCRVSKRHERKVTFRTFSCKFVF